MSASSIRQIHWIMSAALAAAVRWEWIRTNPAETRRSPSSAPPEPEPPTAAEAARLIEAAWLEDDGWGVLVWLVMVTGMRRAEVAALRWSDVDLDSGMLAIRRNYVRSRGRGIEKDTKSHQMRRISLDAETVLVLAEHRERYEAQVRALAVEPADRAFVFSYQPTHDAPVPSGITHRYGRMCRRLGIDSHLHALRHYSATELLTAGVDLRTVAADSATAAVARPRCASTRRSWVRRTSGQRTSWVDACGVPPGRRSSSTGGDAHDASPALSDRARRHAPADPLGAPPRASVPSRASARLLLLQVRTASGRRRPERGGEPEPGARRGSPGRGLGAVTAEPAVLSRARARRRRRG
jgi:site-specific recombinase XerC